MKFELDIDKKWKYLQFVKNNGFDGWSLDFSDVRNTHCSNLLSIAEINGRIKRDETFAIIFNAMASDPQLIECSDGLHEAVVQFPCDSSAGQRWRFFPVYFNRTVYCQFSHYVRKRKQFNPRRPVIAKDLMWMNDLQLKLARRLLIELFYAEDTSEVDRLIAFKQDDLAT